MRKLDPRALYIAVSLFICLLFATSAFGQAPDPQATPTPTPDPTASPTPDPTTATDDQNATTSPDQNAASAAQMNQDRADLDSDTDSADLPSFFKGSIDTEDYLRMRNAHNR